MSKLGFWGWFGSLLKWSRIFYSGTRNAIFGNPKTAKMGRFGRFGDLGANWYLGSMYHGFKHLTQVSPKTDNSILYFFSFTFCTQPFEKIPTAFFALRKNSFDCRSQKPKYFYLCSLIDTLALYCIGVASRDVYGYASVSNSLVFLGPAEH